MKTRILLAAALTLAPGAAMAADTRELVLARAARCGQLAVTREWLDCYYAAAQSVRNELGLVPAPQAERFETLFAGSLPPNAPAPVASAPSAPMPGAPVPVIVARAADVPEPRPTRTLMSAIMGYARPVPAAQFGLRNARPAPSGNVDRITSRMSDYKLQNDGGFRITLANGQVWQGDITDRVPFTKAPSTYIVTIAYGALNTFNLTIAGKKDSYKVVRLK